MNSKIRGLDKIRGFETVSADEWMKNNPFGFFKDDWMKSWLDLELPKRSTKLSSGYDVISPVEFNLEPGNTITIPTGFKAYMMNDEVLMGHVRSSIGFKYTVNLVNGTMIGDADYYNNEKNEGHYFIKLVNRGDKVLNVKAGEAFAQVIFQKYLLADGDDFESGEERTGGIGSTNK